MNAMKLNYDLFSMITASWLVVFEFNMGRKEET